MNLFDRIVSNVDPKKGIERMKARKLLEVLNSGGNQGVSNSGYSHHGASSWKKTFKNWWTNSGTADEDISENLRKLRERSRDLYMGSPIATGALKTKRTASIGKGLRAKPTLDYELLGITQVEARKMELDIERKWKSWAEKTTCDGERRHNFYTLQRLLKLSMDMNGDVFWLPQYKTRPGNRYDLVIQLVEGDRVSNPSILKSKKLWSTSKEVAYKTKKGNQIIEGVELNEDGEVVAYHISNRNLTTYGEHKQEHKRVEAYGKKTGERVVYHLFDPERIGQSRGVPLLAPVIGALKDLTRYTDAEIKRSVIMGMFTAFITKENPTANLMGMGNIGGVENESAPEDDTGEETIKLGAANIVELSPGENIKTAAPNSMNVGFEMFVKAVCVQVGAAIEIPVDVLLKQFNSSYSASRASLMEFWRVATNDRDYIIYNFCQPVYERFIMELLEKGDIHLPGFFESEDKKNAYTRCMWVGEAKGHLDPVKEIKAATARVNLGISSLETEAQEIGNDWEEMHKQSVIEKKKRVEDGLEEDLKNENRS